MHTCSHNKNLAAIISRTGTVQQLPDDPLLAVINSVFSSDVTQSGQHPGPVKYQDNNKELQGRCIFETGS